MSEAITRYTSQYNKAACVCGCSSRVGAALAPANSQLISLQSTAATVVPVRARREIAWLWCVHPQTQQIYWFLHLNCGRRASAACGSAHSDIKKNKRLGNVHWEGDSASSMSSLFLRKKVWVTISSIHSPSCPYTLPPPAPPAPPAPQNHSYSADSLHETTGRCAISCNCPRRVVARRITADKQVPGKHFPCLFY